MTGPSEQTLLDMSGCRLTTRRLVTPDGATYMLHQITSTRLEWRSQGTAPAGCLGIVALGALASGGGKGLAVAAGVAVAAALAWRFLGIRSTAFI